MCLIGSFKLLVVTVLLLWSDPLFCEGRYIQLESDRYDHQSVRGLAPSSNSVTFTFRGCKDARISLQPSPSGIDRGALEIVIGGWHNSKSGIKKGFESYELVVVPSSGIVNCNEARHFWVSWSNSGVSVGKGNVIGQDQFMYTTQAPWYSVTAFTVTGWNDERSSISVYAGVGQFVDMSTLDRGEFRPVLNYYLSSQQWFTFSVRACNDAHVRLEPASGVSANSWYELVIGGWGNSQSVIRKGGKDVAYSKGSPLDCNAQRQFWISWNDGHIRLGALGTVGQHILLDYVDVWDVYPVGTISVLTGWGSSGNWHFD